MSTVKNLVLLGAGRIGQVHAQNVVNSGRAKLVGVVDVHAPAAQSLAERTGARAFASADEALDQKGVDGVLICTSTDTHVDMIVKSAQKKLPIFCEKPVDLDMQKVDRCLDEVKKANVALLMGFNRRFDVSFRNVKDRIAAKEIGALESVKITSRDPRPPPPAYVKVSGGLFRDMMIHDFDMARFLLDEEPVSVFATGSVLVDKAIGDAGDVDTAMVVLKTKSGKLAHIDNSRRAVYGYDQRIEAFGSGGVLFANNPTKTTVVSLDAAGVKSDVPFDFFIDRYAQAYRDELSHFLDVIEGKAKPIVTGEDGKRALALADAAVESLKSGRVVEVQ